MSSTRKPTGPAPAKPFGRLKNRTLAIVPTFRDRIYAHVETHIGPVFRVLHETKSENVHLDLLVIAPSDALPCTTLVTSGMSERAMNTPFDEDEARNWQRCELVLGMPADWNGGSVDHWSDESFGPIARLLHMARYPHANDTWIGPGHTVASGPPGFLEPWAKKFSGLLIDWPFALAPDVGRLEVSATEAINFYGLYFLTPKELSFKLAKGADALAQRLSNNDVTFVFNPNRKCTAPDRGWLRQVG